MASESLGFGGKRAGLGLASGFSTMITAQQDGCGGRGVEAFHTRAMSGV